jgi:adenylate cyclase
MKKLPFILLFCIFCLPFPACIAESRVIDSLYSVLKSDKEDTSKVNTLNALSTLFIDESKFDSSVSYANKALFSAEELNFNKGIGSAYINLGNSYSYQSNYSLAIDNLLKAYSVFVKMGNMKRTGNCLMIIGEVYVSQGNYPKALEYYNQVIPVSQEIHDKYMSAEVYYLIGEIYWYQQNYSKSLVYLSKSLEGNREIGDKDGQARNLCMIGIIYTDVGKYDSALNYLFKSLEMEREIGNREIESNILENIGEAYIGSRKYPQALEFVFKSLALTSGRRDKRQYGYDLIDIGQIYTRQKKYAISRKYLDSALLISKQTGDKEFIKNVYYDKTELDSATRDYKAELQDNKYYTLYHDSLKNEKTLQEELNDDFDRRQDSVRAVQVKRDAVAAKEIENQKRIRNYILTGLGIVCFFLVFVFMQRNKIAKEKKRSERLLLNILPAEVAEELKERGSAEAKTFDNVTVVFTDFKGFTLIAEKLTAKELVAELHYCFNGFDNIIHKYSIEKIKTIGDSYMAAGGLPVPNTTHAKDVVNAALEMVDFMESLKQQRIKENRPVFEVRIGINSGPVVAGIVGIKKFAYDIWGDTVNLASRMESSGEPGKVNISGSTYELVKNNFPCTYRGKIAAKNKGEVDMYFVGNGKNA